ncbi:MAG: hypothetical protein AB1706_17130 [Pseudomonadota bacterium]
MGIASDTNSLKNINLGGGIVSVSPTPITNPDTLPSNFIRLGKTKNLKLTSKKEYEDITGGTPLRDEGSFVKSVKSELSCECMESDFRQLAWALGEDPIYTVSETINDTIKAATTPTVSAGQLTDGTGFAANDIVEFVFASDSSKHYRRFDSLDASANYVLDTPLPVAPAAGDAVNLVTKVRIPMGDEETPVELGLKFEKPHARRTGKTNLWVWYTVQAVGDLEINFADGEINTLPMTFKSLSKSTVANGRPGHTDIT